VCKSGSIFPKTGIFDPFFPEIFGIFGDSGDFPGKNFPEIGEFSGGIFPEDFSEIGRIFARPRKKQEKTARFFRGFPGDFPGDFPGISRRLFSEKTWIFFDFHPDLWTCTLLLSARSGKNPQISGKFPGISGIPRNPRKKFPEISGNSVRRVFGEIFPDFHGFSPRVTDAYPASQRAFWKKPPEFPEKFPGISGIPGNPRKIFPEIPGNSIRRVFGETLPYFPESLVFSGNCDTTNFYPNWNVT